LTKLRDSEYSKCPLARVQRRLETPALLVNGIVNNALFHSSSHINQTLHFFC